MILGLDEGGEVVKTLLELLFPKKPKHASVAYKLLSHVKHRQDSGQPYLAAEWRDWCLENDVDMGTYQYVLKKLRKVGLLVKSGGHTAGKYFIGSSLVDRIYREWNEWLVGRLE